MEDCLQTTSPFLFDQVSNTGCGILQTLALLAGAYSGPSLQTPIRRFDYRIPPRMLLPFSKLKSFRINEFFGFPSKAGVDPFSARASPLLRRGFAGLSFFPRQQAGGKNGADRDRTDDLVIANDALFQLSYSPLGIRKSLGKGMGLVNS